ncbi:MAG: dihydrolipoyl dehydrogenase [Thaumarchaeota archaeon]|nr:dihydrolipoyl dehydrogenase [Nitrososphaerota archaeon]
MINDDSFDVVVVGGGPGGYSAAIRASQLGGRVALIENDTVGGVCTNRGCIPTKFLLGSAELLESIRKAKNFGITVSDPQVDLPAMIAAKEGVVKRLVKGIEFLLSKNRVKLYSGFGSISDPGSVRVAGNDGLSIILRAKNTILATGSESLRPPIEGMDGEGILTSDEVLKVDKIPSEMIILGGGPEGVEFASIFQAFGTKIHLIDMLPRILPKEDSEIGTTLQRIFERSGVSVHCDSRVVKVGDVSGKKIVEIAQEGARLKLEGEVVLLCMGRKPNITRLGLEIVGLKTNRDKIQVNSRMETNVPSIYAVGDCASTHLLAYTAAEEGIVAAQNALGSDSQVDYSVLPRCIFCKPEVGAVGITEDELRNTGMKYVVGKFSFRANGRAISAAKSDGFVKILSGEDDKKILGVHILGPYATEIVHQATLAMKLGATLDDLAGLLYGHPTFSESLKEAAYAGLGRPLNS